MDKVTISDVAKLAGVSTTTVSRVINNIKTVKERNRLRVLDAIKELKYKPNVAAQQLAGSKINTIGLLIPKFEDMLHTFYAIEIIKGISYIVEKHNFDLLLRATSFSNMDSSTYDNMLNISQAAGVLFADVDSNETLIGRLKSEGVPFVVMNNFAQDPDISYVAIDNKSGTKEIIKYLIDLGHTKIAMITGDLKNQSARGRFFGFKEVLEASNIKDHEKYMLMGNWTKESARSATEELLKFDERPTAIFAASDEMAYEVVNVLRNHNIRIPDDISVAGFDNSPFSTISEIPITTVHQPIYEMAREACAILINLIEGKEAAVKRVLSTRIIERGSCKKIK